MTDPRWIAALEAELDNYRRAGRSDRAAEVEAELAKLGVTGDKPAKKPARTKSG